MNFKIIYIVLILFCIIEIPFFYNNLILWDESVYLGMGKYIYSNGELGLWENLRPIIIPLIIGIFWKMNINYIITSQIIALLFSLATIIFTYHIAKELFDEKIAIIAAILLIINPLYIKHSTEIMTDILATSLVLFGIILFNKKEYLFSGIFCSIGFLTKYPAGIIFFSLLIYMLYKKHNLYNLRNIIIGFLILLILFLIINQNFYGDALLPLKNASTYQSNKSFSKIGIYNIGFYFIELIKQSYIYLLSLIGIIFILKNKNKKLIILIIPLFLYLIYFTYITMKHSRYIMLFISFIVILTSKGIFEIYNKIKINKILKNYYYITIILLLLPTILQDYNLINIQITREPSKVIEVHDFLGKYNNVLTTDPVTVAYKDIKIIPYYYSILSAEEVYNKNKANIDAILFTKDPFPCEQGMMGYEQEQINNCINIRERLFNKILNENKLVFNKTIDEQTYYIFEPILA